MAVLSFSQALLAQNYDFSDIAPSGQTLYYTITSDSTVQVIAPGGVVYSNSNWAGYTSPTGSLTIPSTVNYQGETYSVSKIAGGAFMGCTGLTSVTIPSCIKEIGDWAFCNSDLSTINFPSSAVLLGGWVFESTPWLDNKPAGLVYLNNLLYCYVGVAPANYSPSIPSNVNSIAGRAFCRNGYEAGQTNLISVQIPNTVKYIGNHAFYKCHLNTISLPDSVEIIDNNAFAYNYFPEVTIPSSVKLLGNYAFSNCASLTTVNYNAISAHGIDYPTSSSVFGNCYNLTTVNWGDNIQTIPAGLLYGCSNITGNLNLPNTITLIEKYAFYGCSGLSGSLVLPLNTAKIEKYAFYGCSSFSGNLSISSGITEVGESAFYGCSGLTSMDIDANIIGAYAFDNCTNIVQLTIGENVDSVGQGALYNFPNLNVLNYSARNLHSTTGVLSVCQSLSSISFGSNVQHLPNNFMQFCSNLDSVSFPSSLISIGQMSFYNSGIAGEIVFPENLQNIGSSSFTYCFNITSLKCMNSTPPNINASVFPYLHDKPLYVPCSSLGNYQSASGWSLFQNIAEFEDCGLVIDASSSNSTMGYVQGGGTYNQGETCTLTAIPYNGYRFDHWQDGNTDNPRIFTVNSNATYIAYFVSTQGIDDINEDGIRVYSQSNCIIVEGTNETFTVFDLKGRSVNNDNLPLGVYMVKIGNHPARKVVIMR